MIQETGGIKMKSAYVLASRGLNSIYYFRNYLLVFTIYWYLFTILSFKSILLVFSRSPIEDIASMPFVLSWYNYEDYSRTKLILISNMHTCIRNFL
jgi:hypothetical protein